MTIDVFSKRSVDNAIKQLRAFKSDFHKKLETFLNRCEELGVQSVRANVNAISPLYKGGGVTVTSEKIDNGFRITITGDQVAFIEFGSGITFNTPVGGSKHPKGQELGLTIGSYNPESPNASSPYGWWYKNRWGESEHTYGTPAFAPLYNGELEIIRQIEKIAKEVFNG